MNVFRLLATLGTTFLLASLLGPRSFGVVALALIYITLFQLLMQQGLIPAIIQRKDLSTRHLDSAFWLTMMASALLMVVSVLLASWWAGVNDAPEAKTVVWALSILVLVKGLIVVQEALLRRQLRFRELAIRTSVASIAGASVGISWALIQPNIWALVAQQLTTDVVGCAVLWSVSDWRPRLQFWVAEARELLGFAGKASLSSIGVFLNNRVDALLIGVFFGATAVGLYRLAARLVETAIEFSVQPIQTVSLPEFSRYQDDADRARSRYLTLVLASSTVAAPLMAAVFASADPLMRTLGSEWGDAVIPLQLLCVVGMVRAVTMLNGAAMQSIGRPGAAAAMTWLAAVLSAGAFALTGWILVDSPIEDQVVGMAASRAILYALVLLPLGQVFFVSRLLRVRGWDLARLLTPTVVVSVAAGGAGAIVARAISGSPIVAFLQLLIVGSVTVAASAGLLWLVNPEARRVFQMVVGRLRRPRLMGEAG